MTNLELKPLGRGQDPSPVIVRELALFAEYKAELNNALGLKCPVAKAQALRNAFVNHLNRNDKGDQSKRVRELYRSLNLPI